MQYCQCGDYLIRKNEFFFCRNLLPSIDMKNVEYTVKCPRCSAKAVAIMKPIGIKGTYREPTTKMGVRRLLCESCGLSKEVASRDAENYELWYATSFRGQRIWARNKQHLSFLISWFSGEIREADVRFAGFEKPHFETRVMVESFPKWMGLAKNRQGVLKCLAKMNET